MNTRYGLLPLPCNKPALTCLSQEITTELQMIERTLAKMGATREYCLSYFRRSGGTCARVVSGQCVRHSCTQAPLPEGLMCSQVFGNVVQVLRQHTDRVERERVALRREWDELKHASNRRVSQENLVSLLNPALSDQL